MSSSILSNLGKIQKLKNRSNFQSWKSTIEGVLELEGLWGIVNGDRPKPDGEALGTPSDSQSSTNTETLKAWTIDARKAWITIDLSISNELRHISRNFTKDDPVGLWKHLEKKFQPDTAIEASRLYRQLLEIEPKDDETAEQIIERIEKAKADLVECVGDVKVDELLGSLILFKLTPGYKDLVNLVYSTQKSSKALTFDEASSAIRRLVTAESVGEPSNISKSLVNRTKGGRVKKDRKGKVECYHCKKPGHKADTCWVKHPELAPESFKKALEEKSNDDRDSKAKKQNPIRASVCRSRALKATTNQKSEKWFLDSGATDNMMKDKHTLRDFKAFSSPKDIQLGDDSIIQAYRGMDGKFRST